MTLTTGGDPLQIYKFPEQIISAFENFCHAKKKLYLFFFAFFSSLTQKVFVSNGKMKMVS